MEMKYIVYQDDHTEIMVTFPKVVNHDRMADAADALKFGNDNNWHRRHGKVVSAGFINGHTCYGMSESLKISSRPEIDTALYQAGGTRMVETDL